MDVIIILKRVFIKMRGGLGNQLFMLSYAIGVSKSNGDAPITIDASDYRHYKLRNFELTAYLEPISNINIDMNGESDYRKVPFFIFYYLYRSLTFINAKIGKKMNLANVERLMKKFGYHLSEHGDGEIISSNHSYIYIYGYFQDSKLVDHSKEDLLAIIKNPVVTRKILENETVYKLYKKLKETNKSLAVSMRCGADYIDLGWPMCTKEYYIQGIKSFVENEKVEHKDIYIFSDNIVKAKEILMQEFPQLKYVDNLTPIESLFAMSLCDNFIISNSSFAWWGQELSSKKSKKVLAPVSWFKAYDYNTAKIYRKNFMIMDNTGRLVNDDRGSEKL